MDRRTITAFAIIALIIIATPYYMRWVRGEDPLEPPINDPITLEQERPLDAPPVEARRGAQPKDVETTSRPFPDTPSESAPAKPDTPVAVADTLAPPTLATVETDLFRIVVSSRGGRIVSVHLKEYLDSEGNTLELMPPGAAGLGVRLGDTDLSEVTFTPNRTSLSVFGPEQDELKLTANLAGRSIVKTIRFQGDRYRMAVSLSADRLMQREGLGLAWDGGLAHTENLLVRDPAHSQIVTYAGGEVEKWNPDRIRGDENPPSGQVTWVGVRNKYFVAAMIPPEGRYDLQLGARPQVHVLPGGRETRADVDRLVLSGRNDDVQSIRETTYQDQRAFVLDLKPGADAAAFALALQQRLGTGVAFPDERFQAALLPEVQESSLTYGLYLGPISYYDLRTQNIGLSGDMREINLDLFMDYGWAILRPIMKPLTIMILRSFLALHEVIPNFGLVIVIFSILVKITVFPLTHKSLESAAKMQEAQPQITALKEKYTDDSQKLNQEMMKLYKEQKINPLGGCLPMLLQMPILISLFNVFRSAIQLRQTGFVFWITDLAQPDRLMVGGFEVHVLPLLMGISSFFQSKLTMKDPKQAAMVYVMPVMMTFIFWSFSSGLVIYWTMFNLLTLIQQRVMETTKKTLGTA